MDEKCESPFLKGVSINPQSKTYMSTNKPKSNDLESFSSSLNPKSPLSFSASIERNISDTRKNMVKTPEWTVGTQNSSEKVSTNLHYNLFRKHMRLEIIESRINDGIDEVHLHPALSSEIENKREELKITKSELKLKANYRFHKEEKKIPKFWEPRIWDNQKDVMDQEESDKLYCEIVRLQEKVPIELFNQNKSDSSDEEIIRNKRRRRKSGQSIWVDVSMLDYQTDNSEDNTDWDALDL